MKYEITYYNPPNTEIGKIFVEAESEEKALIKATNDNLDIKGYVRRATETIDEALKKLPNFSSNEARLERLSTLFDRFNYNKDSEEETMGTINDEFTKQDLLEIVFQFRGLFGNR